MFQIIWVSLFILAGYFAIGEIALGVDSRGILSRYSLVGVISADNPRDSLAVVKDRETNRSLVLRQGQSLSIENQWSVKTIERNELILRSGDQSITIRYEGSDAKKQPSEQELLESGEYFLFENLSESFEPEERSWERERELQRQSERLRDSWRRGHGGLRDSTDGLRDGGDEGLRDEGLRDSWRRGYGGLRDSSDGLRDGDDDGYEYRRRAVKQDAVVETEYFDDMEAEELDSLPEEYDQTYPEMEEDFYFDY